jgi:hypothetical protein
MSGPIVRRYGFPNFEKIFGERRLEHGVEESETPEAQAEEAGSPTSRSEEPAPAADSKPKKPDKS